MKSKFSVSASHLAALAAVGDIVFQIPILVTVTGIIIDGYARYELARKQDRQTILCLEYDLTEEEALRWLIHSHRPLLGLNAYARTLLALDLEPSLQEAARTNQRLGGQRKGSSNLTEAQAVDVRSEIAGIAGVSSGNVTKARQTSKSADPVIQQAVKAGEISLHKAWQWSGSSAKQQLQNLEELRGRKGTNQTSRRLIQKHVAKMRPTGLFRPKLSDILSPLIPDRPAILDSIVACEIDAPGRFVYFTTEALKTLRAREGLGWTT